MCDGWVLNTSIMPLKGIFIDIKEFYQDHSEG